MGIQGNCSCQKFAVHETELALIARDMNCTYGVLEGFENAFGPFESCDIVVVAGNRHMYPDNLGLVLGRAANKKNNRAADETARTLIAERTNRSYEPPEES